MSIITLNPSIKWYKLLTVCVQNVRFSLPKLVCLSVIIIITKRWKEQVRENFHHYQSSSVVIIFVDNIAHRNDAEVHDQEVNDEDEVLAADNFDSGHASLVSTSVNISLPFVFSFFRGRIRDGHNVPSENVCHMSGIQSHIPEIIVALSDRVQVRVRRISGVFSPIPDIWHTFSLGTSWPSRFRPQKQHLSTP